MLGLSNLGRAGSYHFSSPPKGNQDTSELDSSASRTSNGSNVSMPGSYTSDEGRSAIEASTEVDSHPQLEYKNQGNDGKSRSRDERTGRALLNDHVDNCKGGLYAGTSPHTQKDPSNLNKHGHSNNGLHNAHSGHDHYHGLSRTSGGHCPQPPDSGLERRVSEQSQVQRERHLPLVPYHPNPRENEDISLKSLPGSSFGPPRSSHDHSRPVGPKPLPWHGIGDVSTDPNRALGGSSRSSLQTFLQTAMRRITRCAESLSATQNYQKVKSVNELNNLVNGLRLRFMPPQGSRLDRILLRAEGLADASAKLMAAINLDQDLQREVLNIPMNCFGYLLQISIKQASIELQKAFGLFDQVAVVLSHIGQQPNLSSKLLSDLRIKALTTSLNLDLDVLEAFTIQGSSTSSSLSKSNSKLSSYLTTIQEIEDEFSLEIWRLTVENTTYGGHGIMVETIRSWLSGREISIKTKNHASIKPGYSETELPLKWMTDLTHKFWKSQDSMLLITGEGGCGKSGIYRFLLDRSRARYSRDTRVLYFGIEPLSSTQRSPLHLVKNLLLQLFEKSVGNIKLFDELCRAYKTRQSPEIESLLWSILKKEALKVTADQGFSSLLIVVDGLDKIEGGNKAALIVQNLIYDIVIQSPALRCVILSRPIFDEFCDPGVHHYPVDPSTTGIDIRFYIEKQLRSSRRLRFLTSMEMDVVIERALRCHIPSFTQANLLVAYIEIQQTYQAILSTLQTVPSTKVQLIEHLIGHIDFNKTKVTHLFYWLMVSKRLMTVHELEIMTDSNFVSGTFGADPPQFLRDTSASLVEIRDGTVRFIDPLVKSTLLNFNGRLHSSLTAKAAQKFALKCCLEYLKRHLKVTGQITMDALDQSVDKNLRDQISADRLLEYSIRYYVVHYSECHFDGVPLDLKDAYIDSPQLAHCEHFYWSLEVSGDELEHLHQRALDFRKAIFGGLNQSVIQNLITLSMLKITAGKHDKALGFLGEAWNISRQLLGEKSLVCKSLAQKYSKVYFELFEVGEGTEPFAEELFEFLWTSEQAEHGSIAERTLSIAELLIGLYQKKNRSDDVARLLYGLYRDCISTHGQLDSRTINYAERLILVLTDLGRFSEVETLCRQLLTAADCTLELWDPRYLTILFSLVDWYVNQSQFTHAKDELQTSWQAIYGVLKKRQTHDTQLAFVRITIRLFKLFRKQDHHAGDASHFMKHLWSVFSTSNAAIGDRVSSELLNLSECYIDLHLYEEVIPLLQRLRLIFSQDMIKYHAEATRVAIALSTCYRHQTSPENNIFSLKELFDSLLAMNIVDDTLVDLATQLANLYIIRKDLESAKLICHSALQIVWAELVTFKPSSPDLTLPIEKQECSIRIALILSDVILEQGNISGAVSLLRSLFNCFYASLPLSSEHLFQVAKRLSFGLQSARLTHEAVAMWKEFRAKCVLHLGPTHEQCLRIAEAVVALCKVIESDSREEILSEIIDDFEKGFGLWQPLAVNTVLTLISLLEEQSKLDEMQGWYHKLWAAITLHRHSGSISAEKTFSIFLSYSKYLVTIRQKSMAIHIAHELSNILRSEMDEGSILILQTDLELALLLEDDESHYAEAVEIYESICALQADTFLQAEQELILILIEKATEGLTRIYRRHRKLAGKAEDILEKTWKESQRLKGCAHQQTFTCFLKLIDFYTKQGLDSKVEKALQKMAEYIIELLLEEHDEKCLFEMAGKFSDLYRELESVDSGIKFVKQLREEIASLINRRSCSKDIGYGKTFLGKVTFWVIDRRSLVLIASVEKMLSGDHQSDTLYSEVLQSLLKEAALYEAWSNIKLVKCDLKSQLATASRLFAYLHECGRHAESESLKSDAWEVFQTQTQSTHSSSEALRTLFEVGLLEMRKKQPSIELLKSITSACLSLHRNKFFSVCLTIVKWAKEYFAIQTQGSTSTEVTKLGFEMARYIDFTRIRLSDSEKQICEEIQDIVAQIAITLLRRGGTGDIEFDKISTTEVNTLVRVLGRSKDYKMLVEIFKSLWDSRTKFVQWSQPTIISIGCQLCQALFAYNHGRSRAEALELIEAICYNVRGVYGPVHELTIRCEKTRTSFLVAEGEYAMTFDIHAKLMDEIMHKRTQTQTHHHHDDTHPAAMLDDLLIEQGQLMKAAYERNGGWGNQVDGERYVRLMTNVFDSVPDARLHQVGMPSSWQTKAVQRRGARSAITQGFDVIMDSLELEDAHSFGCWKVPVDWTIPHEDVDELDDANHRSEDNDVVLHGRQSGWEGLYLEAGLETTANGHTSSGIAVREPSVRNWYGSVITGPVSEGTVDIHREYEEGFEFPDP